MKTELQKIMDTRLSGLNMTLNLVLRILIRTGKQSVPAPDCSGKVV